MPVKATNSGICSIGMLSLLVIIKKLGVALPQYIIYAQNMSKIKSYRVELY